MRADSFGSAEPRHHRRLGRKEYEGGLGAGLSAAGAGGLTRSLRYWSGVDPDGDLLEPFKDLFRSNGQVGGDGLRGIPQSSFARAEELGRGPQKPEVAGECDGTAGDETVLGWTLRWPLRGSG